MLDVQPPIGTRGLIGYMYYGFCAAVVVEQNLVEFSCVRSTVGQ